MPDYRAALLANGAVSSAGPNIEMIPCLVLIAPAWFQRDDFLDWRQEKAEYQWLPPATWWPSERNGDYTDVFMTFDRSFPPNQDEPGTEHFWSGSDADTLPFDIYDAIGRILLERNLHKGIIWLKPL